MLVQRIDYVAQHAGVRLLDLAVGSQGPLAVGVVREAEMLDAAPLVQPFGLFGCVEDRAGYGAVLHVKPSSEKAASDNGAAVLAIRAWRRRNRR